MLPKIRKLVFEVEFQQTQSPYQGRTADTFLHKFNELRHALLNNLQEFIPVDVVTRLPPSHFILASGRPNRNIYLDSKKNKIVEFPRKNSFEIYVDGFHLFSRLDSGNWPDVNAICEWALRVAEKIVDVEIEKEQGPLKEQLILADRIISPDVAPSQKLPPVSRGFDQTVRNRQEKSRQSNYYPRSRYSSLREDEGLMPYGVDPMNTTTQRRHYIGSSLKSKGKAKSIDKQLKTISKDFYTGSKDQSFHWNIRQMPIKPIFAGRYNGALFNTLEGNGKTPYVELSPLPAVYENNIMARQQEAVSQIKMQAVELRLSQSPLNVYTKHYRIETNKVTKSSGDQIWSPVLCQTPLPLIGEYSFQVFVNSSTQNQVQIGIAPLNYYPRIDQLQKPDNIISFNCGNGQIKDGKHNQFASQTQWREGGVKVTLHPPFCLKVAINTKNSLIEWHANDTIVASAKLTSQYVAGYRAFISLFHISDAISLNQPSPSQNILEPLKKQDQKGTQRRKVNVFSQTGAEVINTTITTDGTKLRLHQNRIYPNLKQKQESMVDEVTQTTLIIEGRIKRQRFHKFLEKSQPQKLDFDKEKEDFSIEDVKTYKTIFANQSNHRNEQIVNVKQSQEIQAKVPTTNLVIVQEQMPQSVVKKQHEAVQSPLQQSLSSSLETTKQKLDKEQQKITQYIKQVEEAGQTNPPTESPQTNHQPIILDKQDHAIIQPKKDQPLQPPQLPSSASAPVNKPQHEEMNHLTIRDNTPAVIVQQQKQVAEKDDAINWQGTYEDGVFKLKPVLA